MQIGICHIRIEGEHRALDLVVTEADEVLVDAAGVSALSQPFWVVRVRARVTDLDDDDVSGGDVHAEQLELAASCTGCGSS